MDYFSMQNASKESELAYAKWYEHLPLERKAKIFCDMYEFGVETVKYNALKECPFLTKAELTLRFLELNVKDSYTPEVWDFIQTNLMKRAEMEWKQRFSNMKKTLDWNYTDIAKFMNASNSSSVKSSISRGLPAFAKLAVCVFEHMQAQQQKEKSA